MQKIAEAKSNPKCHNFFGLLHPLKKITIRFQKLPNLKKITQSGHPE
jgi:hypothetical protein